MNRTPLRKMIHAVFVAAVSGFLIFSFLTVGVIVGAHFWMHGRTGEFLPDLFFELEFLFATPTLLLEKLPGLRHVPIDSFVNSRTFAIILNGFVGAITFAAVIALWKFGSKWYRKPWNDEEKC